MAWWGRALWGLFLGAPVGLVAGVVIGVIANQVFDVSCFEGYCAYLVVLTYAPLGLIFGALAGIALGLYLGRKKASA